jgi:hypothetical protein
MIRAGGRPGGDGASGWDWRWTIPPVVARFLGSIQKPFARKRGHFHCRLFDRDGGEQIVGGRYPGTGGHRPLPLAAL